MNHERHELRIVEVAEGLNFFFGIIFKFSYFSFLFKFYLRRAIENAHPATSYNFSDWFCGSTWNSKFSKTDTLEKADFLL